jgi:hypothetical protein
VKASRRPWPARPWESEPDNPASTLSVGTNPTRRCPAAVGHSIFWCRPSAQHGSVDAAVRQRNLDVRCILRVQLVAEVCCRHDSVSRFGLWYPGLITCPHLAVSDFGTPSVPGGRPAGGFCTHQSSRIHPSQPFLDSPRPVLAPSIGLWYPLAIDFGLLQADSEFGTPTANSPAEPTRPHGTPRHLGPRAIDSDFATPSGHGGILRFRLATRSLHIRQYPVH